LDGTETVVSQPGGLQKNNNKQKTKHKKENEKSYETVSGKKETVIKLVNKHIQMKKHGAGTGLVGARISECDGDRAWGDTGGLESREQQTRACGGDHKEGAGQPVGRGWEPRQAALRGWCWEHGQELVAAERAVRLMSEVEVQHWAELARENRVQVARWCGAAAKRGRQKKYC